MIEKKFNIVGFNEARQNIDGFANLTDDYFIRLTRFSDKYIWIDNLIYEAPYFDNHGFKKAGYDQKAEYEKEMEKSIIEIKNYFQAKDIKIMGFEAAKKNINQKLDKKYLKDIIDFSPDMVPLILKPLDENDVDTLGLEVINFKK